MKLCSMLIKYFFEKKLSLPKELRRTKMQLTLNDISVSYSHRNFWLQNISLTRWIVPEQFIVHKVTRSCHFRPRRHPSTINNERIVPSAEKPMSCQCESC